MFRIYVYNLTLINNSLGLDYLEDFYVATGEYKQEPPAFWVIWEYSICVTFSFPKP